MTSDDGFDEFYQSAFGRLVGQVYLVTGDLGDAEDAVQEAFARASARWAQVRDFNVPEQWVRRVAMNLALDGLRRARRRLAALARLGPGPVAPPISVERVALADALRTLPRGYRQVIVLHHLLELPVEQVARELGIPTGTVKGRLSRGRRALAARLDPMAEEVVTTMDELGLKLAELAEEAAGRARPAGAAAARRRGARRRRRQATGAVVLVASLVAGLVWVDRRPLPTADSTKGWKTFTDAPSNLQFRYPPGWAVDRVPRGDGTVLLVPPEDAGRPHDKVRYMVTVGVSQSFWVGELWMGTTTARGRLPGGQPYLLAGEEPQVAPGQPATSDQAYGGGAYSIDWGRDCTSRGGRRRCGPHRVTVRVWSSSRSAWNRYRAIPDTIVGSVTQLRPTGPSVGDRGRPACRPDQWRLIWPEEHAFGNHGHRFVHQGGVRYRKGPPCHLRLTLRLALLDGAGRRLPVAGNSATTTVEGDLPEDQMQRLQGSWVIDGPFMWRFAWEEWCNKGLPVATLRVTAEGGATLTSPGPQPPRRGATQRPAAPGGCRDRGSPSTLAGWPR